MASPPPSHDPLAPAACALPLTSADRRLRNLAEDHETARHERRGSETNPLEQHLMNIELDEGRPLHRRKPLLYPSELRGHGRATVRVCFCLRKAPLALSKVLAFALATAPATVHGFLGCDASHTFRNRSTDGPVSFSANPGCIAMLGGITPRSLVFQVAASAFKLPVFPAMVVF
jgi:hypothetical protein